MKRAGRAGASLMLLISAVSVGTRAVQAQVQAQQNPPASVLNQIQAANEECKRKYPDPVRQAIDYTTCENRNMELLRPSMVYPDLLDQELANNLMLAEKVQKGKMTLIEMKAVKAQLHSQIVTEFQRRQLAKTAAASRPAAPAANMMNIAGQSVPVVQSGSPQQNTPPKEPHCQTARFGMMLETVCN
jgi:negative regulator of sigma E activity